MIRSLWKSRGFSLLVIAVLALGIGANTALFSIIDRVLLHPFPFRDVDRLVRITGYTGTGEATGIAPSEFEFWRQRASCFQGSALARWKDVALTGVDDPENLFAMEVGPRTFDLLGAPAAVGQTFRTKDFQASAVPVAVLSDHIWRRHFRGDPGIVGKQILLDGQGYTVTGVMRPDFMYPKPGIAMWLPMKSIIDPAGELHADFDVMARLRAGVTLAQAQREMDAVMRTMSANPEIPAGWHARLRPLADEFVAQYRRALLVLWGAVGLVLLIACANAANLMLARASGRRREFAVRAALGAGRLRLARQLIAESLYLGLAAGVLGVALAAVSLRLVLVTFPDLLPLGADARVSISGAALMVTIGIVLLTALLCAAPSCVDLLRASLIEGLNIGSRGASAGRTTNRARGALVAVEVALSMMLLAGAGLMMRSLQRLLNVQLGFSPRQVLTARVAAPVTLKNPKEQAAYFARMLDDVRTVPGVRSVAIATPLPLGNLVATTSFSVEGRPNPPASKHSEIPVHIRSVSADYFSTIGMRLLAGRAFTGRDAADSPGVAIVNRVLAAHYWPGEDAAGKHVSRTMDPKPRHWLTVVGVVANERDDSLRGQPEAVLYLPYTQDVLSARYASLLVRTAYDDPLALAPCVRKRIHEMNPDQPVAQVKTMERWVEEAASQPRFHTLLLEVFAGLALALAVSGIFAVVSYAVAQRTHEIGIRGALGATPPDILRFVVWIGMRPVVWGAVLGIAGAVVVTRVLQAELFETARADPLVFAAVLSLLIIAAIAAALIPAWRASRIDPAETLRAE